MTSQTDLAAPSESEAVRRRPISATNIWLTSGSGIFLIFLFLWLISSNINPLFVQVICILAVIVPIALFDFFIHKVHQRKSAGLDGARTDSRQARLKRVGTKFLGLWLSIGGVAFSYWLFPEYTWNFYWPFFRLISISYPFLIILSVLYFFYVDYRMRDPYDGYWLAGRIILGYLPKQDTEISKLKNHILGWIVKGFFLPLMIVFMYKDIEWFQKREMNMAFSEEFYWWWLTLIFFIDVTYASVGYITTFRMFDSHIRSANPFLLEWLVALICYPPFWTTIQEKYLVHSWEGNWEWWRTINATFYNIWAMWLLILVAFYSWSTVVFGIRFSNLTHRGIITNGPYALTKHPAYISKNIFWWMAALPFLTTNGVEFALKGCISLFLINCIYFLRAKTEEWHLMEDPIYFEYCEWIRENGVFARVNFFRPRRLSR